MSNKKVEENNQSSNSNSRRAAHDSLLVENQRLRGELERVVQSRNELFLQLQRYQGFRRQLRMLLATTYDRLYRKADALSYSSNQSFPVQSISITSDRNKLLERLIEYDNQVLIEKRVFGPRWRRWTSWILKKCLVIPKRIIKLMILMLRKLKSKAGTA